MSKLLISQYHNEIAKIIQYGGSRNETSIRFAFQNLLNSYCQIKDFILIPELAYKQEKIRPDGTIKDALRLDWGYWESKDQDDNLDVEIQKKLAKGYPDDNILFEDSQTAILIQNRQETLRVSMTNIDDLDKIINTFINYTRPEVKDFREAIDSFKADLPTILTTLRELIDNTLTPSPPQPPSLSERGGRLPSPSGIRVGGEGNKEFQQRFKAFLKLCQESINSNITSEDVREMIIQHILTEDIFLNIFNESQFHRENNIARELQRLIETFFTGNIKRQTLSSIERYYGVIRRTAANIVNYHEKQKFLKVIYENFYKAYNPLTADRLGIVYTPNEIVKFMIESTDYLTHKHFNKLLADPNVEILDPATGTGTFVTELIEYLPKDKLKYKYQNEIHCNEVAILPYYIANLNIEYSYKQKMGEYEEFNNICFVDTLDHTSFHQKQGDLFAMSLENTTRIKRQNDRKISVIIGNPPYNANQQNENDNNKNREYPAIDKRIKDTYVKESTAQKTKVYDMYSRFFRWATDRLNDNGIVAFITNSSFIDAKTFDGFRKLVNEEFSEIYIIDLDGDVRKNPKISGTTHNVFGIQTGVAISFMIKKINKEKTPCKIFYTCRPDLELAIDKLKFLSSHKLDQINFKHIQPDKNNNWINLAEDNDFESLLSLANKETKLAKKISDQKAVFKLFSNGVVTARDEWVTDDNCENLTEKILYFINIYNSLKEQNNNNDLDYSIKWSATLKNNLSNSSKLNFDKNLIIKFYYRPFITKFYYSEKRLSDRLTSNHYEIFSNNLSQDNIVIIVNVGNKSFNVIVTNKLPDIHTNGDSQCLPLYTYDEEGNRQENITDWGLQQFRDYYQPSPPQPPSLSERGGRRLSDNSNSPHPVGEWLGVRAITKEDIFYYIYGVLHNPKYRQKYELNLKREFPRIPFYDDFNQWKNWGKKLMQLHINYETITPYPVKRIDLTPPNPPLTGEEQKATLSKGGWGVIKPKLKADKTKGQILIDDVTTLTEIPPEVWEYKLGNRSAIEWILDQYKEKKAKDSTIAEKFNNYCFSDYKETVIDLIMRITTVSLETMNIIAEMNREAVQ